MIWVPLVGLAVGALLAQRLKIVVLLPVTLAVAIVASGVVATMQASGASSIILIIVVTTIGIQVGYFAGMLVRRGTGEASKAPSFPQNTSARDPVR